MTPEIKLLENIPRKVHIQVRKILQYIKNDEILWKDPLKNEFHLKTFP